ncbi:MAG: metallophosphoesterase family protein [Myxococcales bacterium FL481]|nr:MAG: metallophosphoesterase family protein [Myxococcales bacterium FL481]
MRYGIVSDTHGNREALDAVFAELDRESVDEIVCLGDTVGYGADPNACCDLIRARARHTILGNHDAAVAGRMDYSYYYDAAREALDLHASILSEENRAWLQELPYDVREDELHFCHGSPVNIDQFDYIFSVEQAETCLPIWAGLSRLTLIGHSHLCKAFAITPTRVYEVVSKSFELRDGFRYVVSVGSVGQPRDQDPRASYTIYDTDTRRFDFHRVEYDISAAARRIFECEALSDNFGARLFVGM